MDKYKILRTAERYVIHRRFAQAIREYEKLLQVETPEPTILNTIGDLLLKEGRTEEALNYFHQVASHYRENGFLVKAIAMFKKIHHLTPADLKINETLAELYRRQGLNYEAARHLRTLVERYQRLEQTGDALVHLRQLVVLDPADADMQTLLAQLLEQRGESPRAFEHYLGAATLFEKNAQSERAFEALSRALQIDDTSLEVLERFVLAAASCQKLPEAEKFLAARVSASGQPFPYQMFLGLIEEKKGDLLKARRLYTELRDLGNYHPRLEEALRRTGEPAPEEKAAAPEAEAAPAAVEAEAAPPTAVESFQLETAQTWFEPLAETGLSAPEVDEVDEIEEAEEEPLVEAQAEEEQLAEAQAEEVALPSVEEALQEVDFYLKLGFKEEAQKLLERLVREDPGDERILRRAEKVMILPPSISEEPVEEPEEAVPQSSEDFESEIDAALEALFSGAFESDAVEEVLRYDIVAGREEENSPKVHYDLGLAYKELGLVKDAIQEFLTAYQMLESPANNPQKILCCSMLANAFLHTGDHQKAIQWAREGLQIPDKKDFEWKALQYDLCLALEKNGDAAEALKGYTEIRRRDPAYRDVSQRMQQLTLQVNAQ